MASWQAQLQRSQAVPMMGLSFVEIQIPVILSPSQDKLRPLIDIKGHFKRPGWKLTVQKTDILGMYSDPTEFRVPLYLNGRLNEVTFVATGPEDAKETEQVIIFAPGVQEFRIGHVWGSVLATVGGATLNYHQTGFGDFVSKSGILGLHYSTPKFDSAFAALLDARMTILTVASAPFNFGPQIMEVKADGTYRFTKETADPDQKWKGFGIAGLTYLTMFSNGSPFGFAHLIGPEVGGRVQYLRGTEDHFFGELRYFPAGQLFDVSEHGLNLNLGWTKRLGNLHSIQVEVALSDYIYQPDSLTTVKVRLLALSFGYTI